MTYIDNLDQEAVTEAIAQIRNKTDFYSQFDANTNEHFVLWMFLVNRRLVNNFGIGVFDVADRNWYDEYEAGTTPKEMAESVVEEEMAEMGWLQ